MINIMSVTPGNVLRLKKKHPCGSDQWLVLNIGVDFRLKCLGCGRILLIERVKLERKIRALVPTEEQISYPRKPEKA